MYIWPNEEFELVAGDRILVINTKLFSFLTQVQEHEIGSGNMVNKLIKLVLTDELAREGKGTNGSVSVGR